jgi:hypothetical protein
LLAAELTSSVDQLQERRKINGFEVKISMKKSVKMIGLPACKI